MDIICPFSENVALKWIQGKSIWGLPSATYGFVQKHLKKECYVPCGSEDERKRGL